MAPSPRRAHRRACSFPRAPLPFPHSNPTRPRPFPEIASMSLSRRGPAASAPIPVALTTLALTTFALGPNPACAGPVFQSDFESYDVGGTQAFLPGALQTQPTGVTTGDMNGDGLTDLVVACPGSSSGAFTGNTISVLLRRVSTAVPMYVSKINSTTG